MKYTVITGASSGIGYQTALAFARKGKNLILVARRKEKLAELRRQITEINQQTEVIIKISDLSDTKQTYELYESLAEYEIETWINNAGLGDTSAVVDEDLTKIENLLNVNIRALTILSTLYAKNYADTDGAQLINVSSGMGYMIALGSVVYSASKYYVSAFTEGLAHELKEAKINVKILAPSITETEFIDKANNVEKFDYQTGVSHFHTASEMAGFMMALYESDKVIGIIDKTYEFSLKDQIYPILKGL